MIQIQNIYYMLSYAYQSLRQQGYASCASEEFENTADLLSCILVKGITMQITQGLCKEYVEKEDVISCVRGKIKVSESIKNQTIMRNQLLCNYDELSSNTYLNRILKTTLDLLLRFELPAKRKKELRNLLLYFRQVETLELHRINWKQRYSRNNKSYQMLVSICNLIIEGLLQTEIEGNVKILKFLDEQHMCHLYEKFILEYYRKEFPNIEVNASQIPWQLDDEFDVMLPIMQSDIMLSHEGRTLIIDAKYYSHTLQNHYDVHTIHSNNLYQIFTYVKNKDIGNTGNVAGMLLYAKTEERILPNQEYHMSGNQISVRTLDLNGDFKAIKEQLNKIVKDFFMI